VYEAAALTPPSVAELPPALRARPDLEDLLAHLQAIGVLVQLRTDLLADARAVARAIERLRDRLPHEQPLTAADFKGPLELTRKHLIPLLEYLDRAGVTRREGDLRRLLSDGESVPRDDRALPSAQPPSRDQPS
jgi:selenocysteine-specific elongation factor